MGKLTKKAKGAIIGTAAGLAAIAVGVGLWQPWREPAPVEPPEPPKQTETKPEPQPPEEKGPTLTVGGEEIPCTIYEGDGWSIYVPEGWEVDANQNGGIFYAPAENKDRAARVEVIRGIVGASPASREDGFVSISREVLGEDDAWWCRRFCTGTDKDTWEVVCQAPAEEWDTREKLMNAVARSFTAEEERLFAGMALAYEPDWQIVDGDTVLWLDKDGYIVNGEAGEAVEAAMRAWDDEMKPNFTGRYRMEDLTWESSLSLVQGDYMDTFTAWVWYEMDAEKKEELSGSLLAEHPWDGNWVRKNGIFQVTVRHDGGDVVDVQYLGLDTRWE